MGREKYKDWQKQLVIQNIAHYLSNMVKAMLRHGHVWVPVELLTLVAQIQPSAAKLIGQHFTVKRMMTQVIHKKTKRFSRQKKKKKSVYFNGEVSHLIWVEHAFQLLNTKMEKDPQTSSNRASHGRKHSIWWCSGFLDYRDRVQITFMLDK